MVTLALNWPSTSKIDLHNPSYRHLHPDVLELHKSWSDENEN